MSQLTRVGSGLITDIGGLVTDRAEQVQKGLRKLKRPAFGDGVLKEEGPHEEEEKNEHPRPLILRHRPSEVEDFDSMSLFINLGMVEAETLKPTQSDSTGFSMFVTATFEARPQGDASFRDKGPATMQAVGELTKRMSPLRAAAPCSEPTNNEIRCTSREISSDGAMQCQIFNQTFRVQVALPPPSMLVLDVWVRPPEEETRTSDNDCDGEGTSRGGDEGISGGDEGHEGSSGSHEERSRKGIVLSSAARTNSDALRRGVGDRVLKKLPEVAVKIATARIAFSKVMHPAWNEAIQVFDAPCFELDHISTQINIIHDKAVQQAEAAAAAAEAAAEAAAASKLQIHIREWMMRVVRKRHARDHHALAIEEVRERTRNFLGVEMLRDRVLCDYLERFAELEDSAENINFLVDLIAIRDRFGDDFEISSEAESPRSRNSYESVPTLLDALQKLHADYISETAAQPLNFSAKVSKAFQEKLLAFEIEKCSSDTPGDYDDASLLAFLVPLEKEVSPPLSSAMQV
jgi:hypothetical protein